ncbi:TPA: hypothetical protein ACK210_003524 [Photobacterium damselae subsp. damselae]
MAFELPLVATDNIETKAIKPLSFFQETPLKLIDHGEFWISRVKHLLNSDTIDANNFLFAVERPDFKNKNLDAAFGSLTEEMNTLGVKVYDIKDINSIERFARFNSENAANFQLVN